MAADARRGPRSDLLADELGFEEAFVGEHVTDTLARDTKRIRLGSATVNLANRHPAVTAAEIMDLDRNAIFLESIEHMIALWTHGRMRKRCAARWN